MLTNSNTTEFTLNKNAAFANNCAKMRRSTFTLAEGAAHVENSSNPCRSAFTLAEVLITLGIIGIAAAMTLPSLVNKYQKVALKTSLKKQYSILQQALEKMQAETGVTPSPQLFGRQTFKNQYIKYFNVIIDCGYGSTDVTDNVNASKYCPSEQLKEDENNRRYTEHYKTYNKSKYVNPTLLNNGQFVLSDGALVMIENWDEGKLYISVDVNGIQKSPNIWGVDLFTFQLTDKGNLVPMGAEGTNLSDEKFCSKTSQDQYNGAGCTYRALTDKTYWDKMPR